MSILIGAEIEKALEDGSIKIEPLDRSQVGPGSVDLTLGNDFRAFKKKFKVYHIRNDSRFEDITRAVHVPDNGYIVIKPGEMVLGSRGSGSPSPTTSPEGSKEGAGSRASAWRSMSPPDSCIPAYRTIRCWRS